MSKILGHASLTTTTRYLNIQKRGLHLAIEKLEESQKLAAEQRRKKAEEQKLKDVEAVARRLHTDDGMTPAFVTDLQSTPARKQLPS